MKSRALVIFSGGQDSTTCLYWAKKKFNDVIALTFDYRQKHRIELDCARDICRIAGVYQKTLIVDALSQIGGNALTDERVHISERGGLNNLPSTFVPGRNILFLTLAASFAALHHIQDLVIGACEADFSGYPDCRREFMDSMEKSLSLGLASPVRIHTPLMWLSKAETFVLADELECLDVIVRKTHTCYAGDRKNFHDWGYGCGECPACQLRAKGYREYMTKKGHK